MTKITLKEDCQRQSMRAFYGPWFYLRAVDPFRRRQTEFLSFLSLIMKPIYDPWFHLRIINSVHKCILNIKFQDFSSRTYL